jgi:hypothetical protein
MKGQIRPVLLLGIVCAAQVHQYHTCFLIWVGLPLLAHGG